MFEADNPYLSSMGLQLWTLRDALEKDPQYTLEFVKGQGYKQVELMSISQLKTLGPIIDDLGLEVRASHFNWAYITGGWKLQNSEPEFASFEQLVEKAHGAGLNSLIFAYWLPEERSQLDDYKGLAEAMNRAGEICKQADIQLGYHNHNFEFQPMRGQIPYDILVQRFDPELVKFELDVFWTSIAGYPPLDLMEKLKGRLQWLHLKDKKKQSPIALDTGEVPQDAFQPLGKGEVDIKAVVRAAPEAGVLSCMVEQDFSPAPLEDIGVSMQYLKNL